MEIVDKLRAHAEEGRKLAEILSNEKYPASADKLYEAADAAEFVAASIEGVGRPRPRPLSKDQGTNER